jgi:hypothetical protein
MIEPIYVPYKEQARGLIQEGDVFLFRGKGIVSKGIQKVTQGRYSHVGLASWHHNKNNVLELVEFREWKGGRTTAFAQQLKKSDGQIDVYRVLSPRKVVSFNPKTLEFSEKWVEFKPHDVTYEMRQMTGLPYGMARIWWMAKFYMLGLRFLLHDPSVFDDTTTDVPVLPVCSTAVATCFSRHNFDLIKNRSDERTTPVDIARSPLLTYMFTPTVDW